MLIPLRKLSSESREDVNIFSTSEVLSCGQADGITNERCQSLQHILQHLNFCAHAVFVQVHVSEGQLTSMRKVTFSAGSGGGPAPYASSSLRV